MHRARRSASITIQYMHGARSCAQRRRQLAQWQIFIRTDDLVLARLMKRADSRCIHQVKFSQQDERGSNPKRTARVSRFINATLEAAFLGHNEGWQADGEEQQVGYCMMRVTCGSLQRPAYSLEGVWYFGFRHEYSY